MDRLASYLNKTTNQFQNFAALMDNFGTATEATATAINSAGSAATENSRYMESLNAKTQQVKATFQDLANNVIESDLVRSLLDLANAFLQLLNTPLGTLVTQFTLLGSAITGVLTIAPFFTKIFSQFSSVFNLITGASTAATAGVTGFAGALATAAPYAAAVAAGLVLIYTAVKKVKENYDETHPTVEMLEEDIQELNSELETNQTRLEELSKIPWADRTKEQELEIERLKEENAELEKQIKYKNQLKAETWGEETVEMPTQYVAYEYSYKGESKYGEELGDLGTFTNRENLVYAIEQNEKLAQAYEEGTIRIREFNEEFSKTEYIEDLVSEMEGYNQILDENKNLTVAQQQRYKELTSILGSYSTELDSMNDGTTLQNAGLEDLYQAIENVLGPARELEEQEKKNKEAAEEEAKQQEIVNNYLHLTQEQAEQLIVQNPALADSIAKVNDAYYLEANALSNLSEQSKETAKAVIEQNKKRLESTLKTIEQEIDALYAVKGSYAGLAYASLVEEMEDTEAAIALLDELLEALNQQPTSGSYSSSITKEKTLIELLQEELDILDHQAFLTEKNGEDQLKLVDIYKQAQERIHEIAEQYRAKGYAETSKEIRELQELWWGYADEIQDVYDSILEEQEKAWEEALENQISSLEKQQSAYETAFNYMVSQIEKEIEILEEQKDLEEEYWDNKIQALEDSNDEMERQIQLEQARQNLAAAESQQMLVFKDGRFQYVKNEQAISDAQVELEKLEREEALRQEVANLEELKNQSIASIDAQIENWEKYKEEWSSVVDQYEEEQDRLIAEQVLGIELEGENWQLRLDNLQQYVNEYLSIMSQLTTAQNTLNAGFSASVGGTAVSTGGGGGGVSFGGGSSASSGTATIPGVGTVGVQIVDGKTITTGLPVGTIVHTNAGDYKITGVNDSGYESIKVSSSSGSSSSGSSSNSSSSSFHDKVSSLNQQIASGGGNLYFKYAEGTLSAHGGLSLVGENGPELRLLNSGDGILPSNVTKNLMALGQFSIKDLISKMGSIYQYSFDKLVLPGVTDVNSLLRELKNIRKYAIQQ